VNRPFSSFKDKEFRTFAISDDKITSTRSNFSDKVSDYLIGKEIGKGAYAVVKQAVHKPTGTKLAIKIYEKFKLMDPARKSAVKREIQVLRQLDHPNVVRLYEVIDNPKQVIINKF
jgi:serine/threonine protein kinase